MSRVSPLSRKISRALLAGLLFSVGAAPAAAMDAFIPGSLDDPAFAPNLRVRTTAVRRTTLPSQISGYIAEITVRDGDAFQEGQVLARLDCSVQSAQMKRAEAALKKQSALAATTEKLANLDSRSHMEVIAARADEEVAAADLAVARILVGRCEALAPFSGQVAERMAQEKQFIGEGQPLFELVDPSLLELEFIAPSLWLSWFKPGHAFTVHIDETGKDYEAALVRLSGQVDAVSQSIKAYARFVSQEPELLPGMSGEARVQPFSGGE